jgi:hypothetical protein
MIDWIKKMLEDSAGIPDEARVAAIMMVLSFIGLAGWDLIALGHAFNAQTFGIGAGALAAGVGGWMYGRGKN